MNSLFVAIFFSFFSSVVFAEPQKVDFGPLAKYQFKGGELYSDLVGVKGFVPVAGVVDFDDNLKQMWQKKLARKKGVTDVAESASGSVLSYYKKNKTKMAVREYIRWIDSDVEMLKKQIDWIGVCGASRLTTSECQLLKAISTEIKGKDLVAYGMTELMPSANGTLNVRVLDFLLRNAGRQYLDSIPALYDKFTSYDMWQMTQYAVFETKNQVRGASSINVHVKKPYKIPGSVTKLRDEDHHRSAFLFAVYNLRDVLRLMSRKEVTNLQKKYGTHLDEIVQFIAIAHHLPRPAIKGFRRWAANNMQSNLQISLGPKLSRYAEKTEANLLALYQMVK